MDKQLLKLLEKIKVSEQELRGVSISKTVTEALQGTITTSSVDNIIFSHKEWCDVITFLIYARLTDIFDFAKVKDADDIAVGVHTTTHPNKEKIENIWNSLKDTGYPCIDGLLAILKNTPLSDYRQLDKDVMEWLVHNYSMYFTLFNAPYWAFDIIRECQKELDIDLNHGNVLYSVDLIGDLFGMGVFRNVSNTANVTLSAPKFTNTVRMACCMLDSFANFTLVEAKEDCVFPFEDARFDVVVYKRRKRSDSTKKLSDVIAFVKDGGTFVVFNQPIDKTDEVFYQYKIPFVIEICDGSIDSDVLVFVSKKTKDIEGKILYGCITDDGYQGEWYKDKISSCIRSNSIADDVFQVLTKEDFHLSNGSITLLSMQHPKGQENFMWKDLNEIIISLPEGDWVYNTSINSQSLITGKILSNNPFKTNAPLRCYLNNYNNEVTGEHPLGDCQITAKEDGWDNNFAISKDYVKVFRQTFSADSKQNEATEKFRRQLCCRVLSSPVLLYDEHMHKLLKVEASEKHPVCYEMLDFVQLPFDEGGGFLCNTQMKPVVVNTDYDENFIIWQLLQKSSIHKGHILVAPTKLEQYAYYLNQRRNSDGKESDDVHQQITSLPSQIGGMGFKRFRKFKDIPCEPLGNVSILVGANNAGKSTFVKGLLLTVDNLKNLRTEITGSIFKQGANPMFLLDSSKYPNIHIGDFRRALYWVSTINGQIPSNEDITFKACIANYQIWLTVVEGENKHASSVPISQITVMDEKRRVSFLIDYLNKQTKVKVHTDKDSIEYQTEMSFLIDRQNAILIPQLVMGIANNAYTLADNGKVDKRMKAYSEIFYIMAEELDWLISNMTVEYVYAHGISQRPIFDYNDRNDYMADALHDFINENIAENSKEHKFVSDWLKKFEVGMDFHIEPVVGECYILHITGKDDHDVYLADMGMGTSQLITLLFRLATFISRSIKRRVAYKPTIVIEEPEQNMHPKFQSLLADLFYEVNHDYGFNFVVETHSEYLVRRSQVIVAGQNYKTDKDMMENNPFKVYYFPSNKNPYDMKFRTDGNFSEEFGSGFYDEATNLLFKII